MKKALLAALLVSGTILSSAPSKAENLIGALSKAYNNNSRLNSDRASVRVKDEDVAIARSGIRPSIAAFASYTRGNSAGNPYYSTVGSVGIQLDQVIFDGFSTKNNISAAELQAAAQREFLRNSEQNQLYSAVEAYADVYMARRIAALRQENLAALDEQVRADRAKLEVGEGTRTDLAQSEAQRALAVSQLHLAKADVKSKEAIYRQVIGVEAEKLDIPTSASGLPRNAKSGFEIARVEHPAILSARYAVDAASYRVKANEGALLPQVSLRLASSYNEVYDGPGTSGRANSIGLALTVPFYQGGRTSAQIRQSKEQLGLSQIQVDLYVDQVRQELSAALSQLDGAKASVAAYRDSVAANKIALNGRIEENRVGQATTLDVLNSRGMLIDSQVSLVSAERDAVVASYGLVVAIGRMSAQQLNLQVTYYDPKIHFDAVQFKWFGLRPPFSR